MTMTHPAPEGVDLLPCPFCDEAEALAPFLELAREVTEPGHDRMWLLGSKDCMAVFSFAGVIVTLGDLRKLAAWNRRAPSPREQPEGWRPIETAPKDGTHILACCAGSTFGWFNGQQAPPVQTVVHYWSNPGEEGFYTSVSELEPQRPFDATHWKPLDEPAPPPAQEVES